MNRLKAFHKIQLSGTRFRQSFILLLVVAACRQSCILYADEVGNYREQKVKLVEKHKISSERKADRCDPWKDYCERKRSNNNNKYKLFCKHVVPDGGKPANDCYIENSAGEVIENLGISNNQVFLNDDGSYIVLLLTCKDRCILQGLDFYDSRGYLPVKATRFNDLGFGIIPEIVHDSSRGIIALNGKIYGRDTYNHGIYQHNSVGVFDSKGNKLWAAEIDNVGSISFSKNGDFLYFNMHARESGIYGIRAFDSLSGEQVGNVPCDVKCEILDEDPSSKRILIKSYDQEDESFHGLYWGHEIRFFDISDFMTPVMIWSFKAGDRPIAEGYTDGLQIMEGKIIKKGKYVAFEFVGFNIISPDGRIHKIEDRDQISLFVLVDLNGDFIYKNEIAKYVGRKDDIFERINQSGENRISVLFADEEYMYELYDDQDGKK
ncbi:MAG TPA: hypothetical protein PLN69_10145 [bacterium]|nr:hypothetical protein [bacterium]